MAKPQNLATGRRLARQAEVAEPVPPEAPDLAEILASGAARVPVVGPYLSEVVSPPEAGRGSELQGSEYDVKDREENFKKWFGDSKVVDEKGKPLIVYHHGSFDENVDIPSGPMHFGTEQAARERAFGKRIDDAVMEVTAYEADDGSWHWDDGAGLTSEDLGQPGYEDEESAIAYGRSFVVEDYQNDDAVDIEDLGKMTAAYLSIQNFKRMRDLGGASGEWDAAIAQAKAEGYDGIVYRNEFEDKGSDSYIVFKPTQIKSIFNRGTFNPEDPDLLSAISKQAPKYG